ncbi:MAG: hypothetical protein R3284_01950 [Rubricoccaceae bacterium]|nr:hypothetical protein [Rubricoccaceae bacterium]
MEGNEPLLLIYLDAYHLGDPLFLRSFAQDLKEHVGPVILVHGSGEEAERALEANGLLSDAERQSPEALRIVERAVRDLNRRIVHELNEAAIAAVGILGTDRGLLQQNSSGKLLTRNVNWIADLSFKRGVPVIGSLVSGSDSCDHEPPIGGTVRALSDGLEPFNCTCILFATNNKAGLLADGKLIAQAAWKELPDDVPIPEIEAFRPTLETVRVRVTSSRALRGTGLPAGTDLV